MSYTVVSHVMSAFTAAAGTVTPVWNASTTKGNCGIVGLSIRGNTTSAVTEGTGTWVQDSTTKNGTSGQFEVWHKPNIANGESNPVFTVGGTTLTGLVEIIEVNGITKTSPYDTTFTATGSAVASVTAGGAPGHDTEFVFLMNSDWEGNTSGITFSSPVWQSVGNPAFTTLDTTNPAKNGNGAIVAWSIFTLSPQSGTFANVIGGLSASTNTVLGMSISYFKPASAFSNDYQFVKVDDNGTGSISMTEKIR